MLHDLLIVLGVTLVTLAGLAVVFLFFSTLAKEWKQSVEADKKRNALTEQTNSRIKEIKTSNFATMERWKGEGRFIDLAQTSLNDLPHRQPIVICGNSHQYLLREFMYLRSTDITTTLHRSHTVTGTTQDGYATDARTGETVQAHSSGYAVSSVPVPVVSSTQDWSFGCPFCHTSRFEFEDKAYPALTFCPDCNGLYVREFEACPACRLERECVQAVRQEKTELRKQLL